MLACRANRLKIAKQPLLFLFYAAWRLFVGRLARAAGRAAN
jgi:hypothetical protein